MKVKKVPLQDLELWPDEVVCFTAYTDTRNPVQQRRTYVDGTRYAELQAENEKLRKKINALKAHGIEIVDAVAGGYEIYDIRQREFDRIEVENAELRAKLVMHEGAQKHNEKQIDIEREKNAKLKELVLEIWRSCPVDEVDCKKCPHYIGESDYWCDIPIRMEGLGIEVKDE